MKKPIEASEIRKGDLIRFEYANDHTPGDSIALEFVARGEEAHGHWTDGQHFLLHRPQPDVLVPAAAIEALREAEERVRACSLPWMDRSINRQVAINTFLLAVDEASGASDD